MCPLFLSSHFKNFSYFIPEDGDEETQPNVFLAPKPRQPGTPPTLGQVKFAFPLAGTYHFRFKSPLFPGGDREKGAMAVWMDTTNDQMAVPTWKNSIVAKVTRVNVEDDDDDDDDADFGGHHSAPPVVAAPPAAAPARAPVSHQSSMHSAHSTASSDHLDLFDGPSPGSNGGNSVHSRTHSSASANLFDNHNTPAPSPAPPSDLLGMDYGGHGHGHPQQHQHQQQQQQHNDFLGMTAPSHHTPPAPAQPGYGAPYGSTPQQQHQQQQQQQHQQQPPNAPQQQQQNAFNSFTNQSGPFGGLGTPWK
jgi:hypothetical protein